MHGGLVRLSTGEEVTPQGVLVRSMQVAWEGRSHSLGTVLNHHDTAAGLALLDAMEIEERPTGIALRPRDARLSVVQDSQHAPCVVIPLGSDGMLQHFRSSRYWVGRRPAWAGMQGRGGQLYAS